MTNNQVGAQVASQLARVGTAVTRNTYKAVDSASFILKSSIEGELSKAVGSDMIMSNVRSSVGYSRKSATRSVRDMKSSGARLSVRYDIKGQLNPTSLLRAFGPWGLIEYDTPAHRVFTRVDGTATRGLSRSARQRAVRQRELNQAFGARGTYRGRRPMPVADGVFAYSAKHPGTTGKRPFGKGREKAEPRARQTLNTVVLRGVVEVWQSGKQAVSIISER